MMEVPETHAGRSYHAFTLELEDDDKDNNNNNSTMKCCVVSDPNIDKSAASLTVSAGQMHDNTTTPGIAHLTEHMLFMGSTTYPDENEYDSFLQQHGGHSNAYTDLELTCYYFDVLSEHLQPALTRMASAIFEPLIKTGSLERELQAVDSEHSKNLTQDYWRVHQLSRSLLGNNNDNNKQHPFGNFGTGNKQSLLQTTLILDDPRRQYEKLREEILNFYNQNYHMSNMTLAIIGSQTTQELEIMIRNVFTSDLLLHSNNNNKNNNKKSGPGGPSSDAVVVHRPVVPPLPTKTEGQVVQWVPLRKGGSSSLDVVWVLPSQWEMYKSKPTRYCSHLLGHESPNTLLSLLRDLSWAHDLTADDVSTNCRQFALFTVSIELTTTGLEHVQDVLGLLFHYLHVVCLEIPQWVHDELEVTGNTTFQFLPKSSDAASFCSSLATHMHQYDVEHYLSGAYKIFEYNPEQVREVGRYLRESQHVLVLLGSQTFEGQTDMEDPWYGTNYHVVPSNDSEHHLWSKMMMLLQQESASSLAPSSLTSRLALPAPNDMLPTDFTLLEQQDGIRQRLFADDGPFANPDAPPRCIVDTDTCRLWYKADHLYQSPKVNILCVLRAPILLTGHIETAVLAALWVEVVTELCNQFSYAASMAGLHCGFQDTTRAMEIQVSGYNHKAGILLERICATLSFTEIDEPFFERMRHKLEQHYQSALVAQPYQHGSMVTDLVLEATNKGSLHQRLEYLTNKERNPPTVSDLLHFSKQLLGSFQLEMLVHGNATEEIAKSWANILLDSFHAAPPSRTLSARGVQLPLAGCDDAKKETFYKLKGWNEHDENSCVVNIYQVGPVDIRTNAILSLLLQLLREPAFNMLRTEEQLGYIVFSSVKTSADNIKSLLLLIQSDSYDPLHVDGRMENFLSLFRSSILVNMPDEEFQRNVDALVESMLEKNKNLGEESSKLWHVITNRSYHFSRLRDIAEAAKSITKVDVLRFFDRFILAGSPYRRKLSVQLFGTAHDEVRLNNLSSKKEGEVLIEDPDDFGRNQPLFPSQPIKSVDQLRMPA